MYQKEELEREYHDALYDPLASCHQETLFILKHIDQEHLSSSHHSRLSLLPHLLKHHYFQEQE